MIIQIIYNNVTYEINPERISKDERLDEALDSMKFCFMSKDITTDIPPFTKCVVTDGNNIEYYYCSTTCDKIVEMPGFYYHTAQLVEATKILETFVIGSKSFSVIEGKNNYNEGYNRLNILNNLVSQNYGVNISLSDNIDRKLTDKRSYSFGAGTTYFDMALEICKVQNCLPYVSYISDDGHSITLDIHVLEESNTQLSFNVINKITKNQSVDEYCSDVVTEMDSVVDRDQLTTCIITPRSTSDTIYKDNALLRLPHNCESVKYLYAWITGFEGPACKIDNSLLNFHSESQYDQDGDATVNLIQWINEYSANSNVKAMLKAWCWKVSVELGHNTDPETWEDGYSESLYYDEAVRYYVKDKYSYLCLWKATAYDDVYHKGWISIGLLNKEQWNLLSTDEQPAYIYYDSDSNIITGFRNYKDTDFWNTMIWGSKGPFFKEFYKQGVDDNYIRTLKYADFEDKSYNFTSNGYSIKCINNYHMYHFSNSTPGTNILDYRFKVEYYAKPHLFAKEKKSLQPENEVSWKKSTRSYNNGANTVDFNQLIPAMKRNANMLGLETTSVESLEDFNVGQRTQFGYIISKQSDFNLYNNNKVVNNIVYNCCQNFQQIAQAIGIDTQYEATNVPKNGIVTRYINVEKTAGQAFFNRVKDEDSVIYLAFVNQDYDVLSRPCAKLVSGDTIYLVCETEDNFTFDYAKTESNTSNYYKREAVPYSDDNQCLEYARFCLYIDYGVGVLNRTNSQYDMMPRLVFGSQLFSFDNLYIGKDARERLIFQYKITKN